MFKRFLKVFAIIFTALFFVDWFLGALRFSVNGAQTLLEVLNVPFGIIALRLEQTVPPMTDTSQLEILTIPVFLAMVFFQALLYTTIFFLAKKLLSKEKVRTVLRHIPY